MRLTRAEARQRSRDALIEAAIAEMAAKGYAAARLEDIAESAEVTTGSIYSIFGGKRQLLVAAVERLGAEPASATAELEDPELSLHDVLRGVGVGWFRIVNAPMARQHFAFELELFSTALRDPSVGALLDEATIETNDARLTRLLTGRRITADPTGPRTTDEQARRLGVSLAALMTGLAQRALVLPVAIDEDDFIRSALALGALAQ